MYRKIAVAGVTAAVIIGAGTAALAESGSGTTSGTAKAGSATTSTAKSTSTAKASTAAKKGKHKKGAAGELRRSVHAEVTTKAKDGYVVHSAIRGSVTAVSPTSITVKAADGFTESFKLASTTKVRVRPTTKGAKPTTSTVSALKSGDKVAVLGKATETAGTAGEPTATVVIDGLKK